MFQVQQHLTGCTDLCKPVDLVNPLFRAILGQANLISSGLIVQIGFHAPIKNCCAAASSRSLSVTTVLELAVASISNRETAHLDDMTQIPYDDPAHLGAALVAKDRVQSLPADSLISANKTGTAITDP